MFIVCVTLYAIAAILYFRQVLYSEKAWYNWLAMIALVASTGFFIFGFIIEIY